MSTYYNARGSISEKDFKISLKPFATNFDNVPLYCFNYKTPFGRSRFVVFALEDFGSAGKDHRGKSYRYEVVDPAISVPLNIYSSTKQGALKKGLNIFGVEVSEDEK